MEVKCYFFCLLLSFFLEDLLNWEDENNPSNEFWKSMKGGFKEKVILHCSIPLSFMQH